MANSRYIAIEGPIGVGKTSLARRLADSLDAELVLEQPEANPFLERFYRNPRGARCRRSCSSCSSARSRSSSCARATCSPKRASPIT